ncbi:ester cyclase [Hasllibacter sp. MH4015]|uniref:ester cyclase n=1 Tax=Hasllibacter sp. MH4015 TaxID=2854029 RepID=UPI001CD5ABFD|nr:ester cyclase [Hasllibacter sp. MH4015]
MTGLKPTLAAATLAVAALTAPVLADGHGLAVVERFYTELLTDPAATTPDMVREVVAEDWVTTPTPLGGPGAEGFANTMAAFGQIIPDLEWEAVEILQSGERYIVRGRATGTPVAPFFGIDPPTGNSFDIMSIDIHRVEDGLIVESYHVEEWATAIQQLTAE